MQRQAGAVYYPETSGQSLDSVLSSIGSQDEPPNHEQYILLKAFVERLKVEYLEERRTDGKKQSTPWFDILHGLPGTGKVESLPGCES